MLSDGIPRAAGISGRISLAPVRRAPAGRGFGTAALIWSVPAAELPPPRRPGFYLRYGFSQTGRVFDGEDVLELRPAP